jgi:hypothetical protein
VPVVADHDAKVRPLATVSPTGAGGPVCKPAPESMSTPKWVEKTIRVWIATLLLVDTLVSLVYPRGV